MSGDLSARRVWGRTAGLAAALFLLVVAISAAPIVREWQLRVGDTYFRLAPRPRKPSPVVLVLIDDASLREYGRWPWSRTVLAELTQRLDRAGASVIGLDVLLSEPQTPAADDALRAALAAAGRVVVVDKIGSYPDGPQWIEPIPQFSSVAAVGHAQALLDFDGVCRRFPPRELTPDGARWAFAVEMARHIAPQQTAAFLATYGVAGSEKAGSVTMARPVLIPIAFRRGGFKTVSAASVLHGSAMADLRGRPVIVGFGPVEIGDRVSTPLTGELPAAGAEVHAQVLDSILEGRQVREAPLGWIAALLATMCVIIVIAARRYRGWRAVTSVLVIGGATYAAGLAAFLIGGWIVPTAPLMIATVIGPVVVHAADLLIVEQNVTRQLREIRGWMAARNNSASQIDPRDLLWQLAVLRRLQSELGSAYELHQTLLESTQDLVAIFNVQGAIILKNRRFADALLEGDTSHFNWALLRAKAGLPELLPTEEREIEIELGGELYVFRATPLPATAMSPGGGTMVTFSSLKYRVERDRARAEALGFVTHELRTPLVAIQGFAELLMRYPGSPSADEAPQTIFRESKRLLALIGSYLDVLRLDAGARPLRSDNVDLADTVRRVFDILQPLAVAAEMRLQLEDNGGGPIVADASLVAGAALNLVSNAIKYGKPGTEVRVRCSREGEDSVIRVHNTGEPITPESIPRLFEPYYRGRFESSDGGWGLGLAFVKRIAEKHGGTVHVVSDTAGTMFEIRLPGRAVAAVTAGGTV